MERTIKIDDTLDETVAQVEQEVTDEVRSMLEENIDYDFRNVDEEINNSGRIDEIVDSNTPIYYSEIDGLYYLYGNDFDEAYENQGLGDGSEDNYKQVAIYCYLLEKAWDKVRELEGAVDDFREYMDNLDENLTDEEKEQKAKTYLQNSFN